MSHRLSRFRKALIAGAASALLAAAPARAAAGRGTATASAGRGAGPAGAPPDRRATDAARRRGIALEGAARQVRASDFDDFDLLIAMDRSNHRDLLELAPDQAAAAKVRLLREWLQREGVM